MIDISHPQYASTRKFYRWTLLFSSNYVKFEKKKKLIKIRVNILSLGLSYKHCRYSAQQIAPELEHLIHSMFGS